MEEFDKNQELPVLSDVVQFDQAPQESTVSPMDLLMPVLRRWYVVLLVFLVVAGAGLAVT
jgi:uncharacterized protein involved in exopolysaccharide biosynthesis